MPETATAQNPTEANAAPPVATPPAEPPAPPPKSAPDAPPATPPAAPPPPETPPTYEFRAPQGKEYDSQLIGAYSEGARKAGLTQEKAQELLDSMAPALAARQQEQITAIQQGWVEAAKTDQEIGGANLEKNLSLAATALDKFGTPELRSLLDGTGLGNHPEVVRFMSRAGKALAEDTVVTGRAPQSPVNDAKSFYENSKMS